MKELELHYYMQIGTVVQDEVLDKLVEKVYVDADNFEKGNLTINNEPVNPLASFTCGYRNFILDELNLQSQHIKEQSISAIIRSEVAIELELPHCIEQRNEEDDKPEVVTNLDWEQTDTYLYNIPSDLKFATESEAISFINELIGTPVQTFDRYIPENTIDFGLQRSRVDFWIDTPKSGGVEGTIDDAVYSSDRNNKYVDFSVLTHRGSSESLVVNKDGSVEMY
ncbi:MAG: hypothetical protein ACRC92_17320 [Peptostreptococcaceae bacterium]